jgi:hypothetical protein
VSQIPPNAPRSPDGYYWWDGSGWQLLPPSERGAPAATPRPAPRPEPEPEPRPTPAREMPRAAQPVAAASATAEATSFGRSARVSQGSGSRRTPTRGARSAIIFTALAVLFAIFGFTQGATVASVLLLVLAGIEVAIGLGATA